MWEINLKTFKQYGIRHTLKLAFSGIIFRIGEFLRNPILSAHLLFRKPEFYFYNHLFNYLKSNKIY